MFLNKRWKLVFQLLGTLIILVVPFNNALKTAAFLLLWALTFYPLSRREIILYTGACAVFSIMDIMALRQRIFYFTHPDFLGMPWWEFFMWGFYVLHGLRMLNGPVPPTNRMRAWGLAIAFALAFSCIPDQKMLILVTFSLLFLGLVWFHEPLDFLYTGYFIFLGVLFEYSGVLAKQWGYTGIYLIGLPFWFITLWGSVGLLLRRVVFEYIFHK